MVGKEGAGAGEGELGAEFEQVLFLFFEGGAEAVADLVEFPEVVLR